MCSLTLAFVSLVLITLLVEAVYHVIKLLIRVFAFPTEFIAVISWWGVAVKACAA